MTFQVPGHSCECILLFTVIYDVITSEHCVGLVIFAETPCTHGEYRGSTSGTNLSTLTKLSEQTVWIALGNPCTGSYTKIRIGSEQEIRAAADEALARIEGQEE